MGSLQSSKVLLISSKDSIKIFFLIYSSSLTESSTILFWLTTEIYNTSMDYSLDISIGYLKYFN